MKKYSLLTAFAALLSLSTWGQNPQNHEENDTTTTTTTLSDIISMQQKVHTNNYTEQHFQKVWGRKTYLHINFNKSTLASSGLVQTEAGKANLEFKSDWGASLQMGKNFSLSKRPIANAVNICLDYTWMDINVNHFKAEEGAYYNSSMQYPDTDGKTVYYMPWSLPKYDASFGMAVGPSVTVAPFASANSEGAHFLHLQFYYHVGYRVSYLKIDNDSSLDKNPAKDTHYDVMADNQKSNLGHGLYSTFGVNLSWKSIGIGFEQSTGNYKYKPINSTEFGKDEVKFKSTTKRFFIQFKF